MDKIKKALNKLSAKEKEITEDILNKLKTNSFLGLNIQKLKEQEDIFRVRKGNIRIIYKKISPGEIFILAIDRRSEKTYKNL